MKFLFLLPIPMLAQSVLQLSAPAFLRPAQVVSIPVTLNQTNGITGIQFTFNFPPDLLSPSVISSVPSKQLSCAAPSGGKLTCLLIGINATLIPAGLVATLQGTLSASAGTSPEVFSLNSTLGSNAAGQPVALTGTSASIPLVKNKCDLNGDGLVNSSDLDFTLNQFKQGTGQDLNKSGSADIFDVMVIVLNLLGGACTAQ